MTPIHIFFPPGGFGTTLEYAIRRFSKEFKTVSAQVDFRGSIHPYSEAIIHSAHSFHKRNHIVNIADFNKENFLGKDISTPIYPAVGCPLISDTISKFKEIIDPGDRVIFIEIKDTNAYERNFLFHFNKVDFFQMSPLAYKQWNRSYQSTTDMQPWELREALSLILVSNHSQYFDLNKFKQNNWLTLTTDQILYNFVDTIKIIINYLGLTLENDNQLEEFYQHWFAKQQYVIDYANVVNDIVEKIVNEEDFSCQDLTLAQEAVIQFRLKLLGKELKCFGLNVLPTNTLDFKNIIV
jgi:hypothetical protein